MFFLSLLSSCIHLNNELAVDPSNTTNVNRGFFSLYLNSIMHSSSSAFSALPVTTPVVVKALRRIQTHEDCC